MMWDSLLRWRACPTIQNSIAATNIPPPNVKFALHRARSGPRLKARREEVKRLRTAENKADGSTRWRRERKANVFCADEALGAASVRIEGRNAAEVFGELRERPTKSDGQA